MPFLPTLSREEPVLITPRNVMELFKLLMIFEEVILPLDNSRKCMVEERGYCSGTYKGYIYCRSIEEGNEIRKIIQLAVAENISPHVSVTLKRGCSEFEPVFPEFAQIKQDSEAMQYKEDWQDYEDYADRKIIFHKKLTVNIRNVNINGSSKYTPEEIFCMQYWLRYAATIGDMSYLAIAGMDMSPIPNLKRPFFKNTFLPKKKIGKH